MPNQRAGDADEKFLGGWILKNKRKDKGTNSERQQLMEREIPLALTIAPIAIARVQANMNKWNDNLARAKTFIDTEGRMPNHRAGDADEKFLGKWILNNKRKEKGTNSEREQLMEREIPLAFPKSVKM
jgi:SOS response regulatory protein OraA/RecX